MCEYIKCETSTSYRFIHQLLNLSSMLSHAEGVCISRTISAEEPDQINAQLFIADSIQLQPSLISAEVCV